MKTSLCPECREFVEYFISTRCELISLPSGSEFSCMIKRAYCDVCHEELYIPEINDANCDNIELAYQLYKKTK